MQCTCAHPPQQVQVNQTVTLRATHSGAPLVSRLVPCVCQLCSDMCVTPVLACVCYYCQPWTGRSVSGLHSLTDCHVPPVTHCARTSTLTRSCAWRAGSTQNVKCCVSVSCWAHSGLDMCLRALTVTCLSAWCAKSVPVTRTRACQLSPAPVSPPLQRPPTVKSSWAPLA